MQPYKLVLISCGNILTSVHIHNIFGHFFLKKRAFLSVQSITDKKRDKRFKHVCLFFTPIYNKVSNRQFIQHLNQ